MNISLNDWNIFFPIIAFCILGIAAVILVVGFNALLRFFNNHDDASEYWLRVTCRVVIPGGMKGPAIYQSETGDIERGRDVARRFADENGCDVIMTVVKFAPKKAPKLITTEVTRSGLERRISVIPPTECGMTFEEAESEFFNRGKE